MENIVQAGMIGWQQILLIAIVILVLFGGRKLPELMKGFGKGIKGFKDEMNGDGLEDKPSGENNENK